ncbi:MAG TPA: hypothetical protein VFE60_00620 [Roseiarcus sp.]|jgi:hypothetical protein|nr:hypothetical protein [Roseiarcus sp.]
MDAFKKLLKLRDWLTVADAARHLSILLGDEVTEAHVLRFALDGRLTLSVDFVNITAARCGKIIPHADAKRKIIQTSDGKSDSSINEVSLSDGRVISFTANFTFIEGVWDLVMFGAEVKAIEHEYHLLTKGPAVSLGDRNGVLVTRPDGTWGQLLQADKEGFNRWKLRYDTSYDLPILYPAQAFPPDAVLVVRTSALRDLEALISEPEPDLERPIDRRERVSLLVIIAALAKLAKVNVAKPSAAAAAIEGEAARMGIRVGVRTIEEKLKLIPDVLASKADT